ncbi:MAG: T9SS type A sorting domain-containing protein [Crocinitomicaceae bacterium]|nr:T9SS type A sorting domain-containing protein [Crocinitomicaceae bacterium]
MKRKLVSLFMLGFSVTSFGQSFVATWDFNSIVNDAATATGVNTPSLGSGIFNTVGGVTNTYSTGNPNDLNTTDNSGFQTTGYPALGLNPKTGGVQFDLSTVGFNKVQLEFYQRLSNTAANTWVLQYTLDNTGVSTGGTVVWTDATTYTFTPAPTGTGDIWYLRTFDFSAIGGLNNNANAGFRVVSDFDPVTGNYLAARSTSTYGTGGTCRFDLVTVKEAEGTASIVTASNFQIVTETAGTVNVPVTFANANNALAEVVFEISGYSSGGLGTDFNWSVDDTLTIPALFNGVVNFPITILNDSQAERAETVILKIKSHRNALVSASQYYQIIYVKDNDYVAPVGTNELNMNLLTSFSNGAAGTNSAEIVVYDSSNYRLYIANSIGAKLDIVDFSNPSSPLFLNSVNVTPYGNINSVAVHNGVVAMAVENANAQLNGSIVFLNQDGVFISQVTAGAMPDMITFNKDFTKILTANEGEPDATYAVDPEGSVTIVDLTPGYAALTNANATTVSLTQFNGQGAALIAQGIRIFSTSASVAQDMEPEYIAISDDNTKAYVSLQENNAMLVIDLATSVIEAIRPLGYSDYSTGNGMDASDQTGQVLITSLPVKGAYMPDAMVYSTIGGQGYLFTANEGDSREFGSVVDANRISTLNLDATVFPDQLILKNNRLAGRLSGLKYSGDTDNDGDLDEIHTMGGRSFSIWNAATGSLVFDSKDLIEQIVAAHPVYGAIFNASNSIGTPSLKNRSDDKGPEPEGVTTATINGDNYLFISLERVGGAMIFNINDPANPVYVGYRNNRSTTASGPDLGAEGMIYISPEASPNGNSIIILANEVSSTLSIYQVNTCAEIAGAEITATESTLCEGETTEFTILGSAGSTVQWYLNNQEIVGANSTTLTANESGEYEVYVQSDLFACTDTSSAVQLTVNPLPLVTALITDEIICEGESVVLTGQGALTYTWNNGASDNVSFSPSASANYTVVGEDANGCENTASIYLTVNPLPLVVANVTDTEICEGQNIIFYGSGAQSYAWNNSIVNGVSVMLMNSGTFDLVGTDVNGCTNTDNVSVVVNTVPSISLGADTTICTYNAPLDLSVAGTYASYSWNTGESTASIEVNQTGSYALTVTAANGCTDSDAILVILDPCLGVEDLTNAISVYPNPTSGMITMNFGKEINNGKVELIDAQGRIVLTNEVNGENHTLDISSFAAGIYTVVLIDEKVAQQVRIIKE